MGPPCALFQIAKSLHRQGQSTHKEFAKKALSDFGLDLDDDTARVIWNEAGKRSIQTDTQAQAGLRAAQKELAKEMADATLTTHGEYAASLYRAGLLASARPMQASLVGNLAGYVMSTIARTPAALLDMAVSQVTGMRTVAMKGGNDGFKASLELKKNAAEMVDTFVKGSDRVAMEKYGAGDGKEINYKPFGTDPKGLAKTADNLTSGLVGVLSQYIRSTFGLLQAADVPGQKAYLQRSLQENAYVKALNEGLRGKDAEQRANDLIGAHDPEVLLNATAEFFDNQKDAVALKEIVLESREDVDVGLLRNANEATKVSGALSRVPLLGTLFLPFPKIPTNAALQALEWSPIGAIYGGAKLIKAIGGGPDAHNAQKKAVLALGKSITSAGMIYLGYQMRMEGMLTEPAPLSQTDRDREEAVGRQGGSIFWGGRFYSIRDVPQLAPLLIGAMLADKEIKNQDGGLFAATAQTVGRNVMDMPTMKAAQDGLRTTQMIQRSEIPGDFADKALNNPLVAGIGGSIVPSGVADIATAFDPLQRDARSFKDKLAADLPWARGSLPPRYDALGTTIERNTFPADIVRGRSPDKTSRLNDPVRKEIDRLQIKISTTKRVTDKDDPAYDKDTKMYAEKAQAVGSGQYKIAEEVINSEWYKTASDKDRKEELQREMSKDRLRSLREIRLNRSSPSPEKP
jgi:hypothetical protein